jgi:hypothetical protein
VISGECSDWTGCVAKEEDGDCKSGWKHAGTEAVSDCANDECFVYLNEECHNIDTRWRVSVLLKIYAVYCRNCNCILLFFICLGFYYCYFSFWTTLEKSCFFFFFLGFVSLIVHTFPKKINIVFVFSDLELTMILGFLIYLLGNALIFFHYIPYFFG